MSNFASGKKSKAISDRSGVAFPYNEMIKEWNGSFVHRSEFEAKHPQIEPNVHKADAQSLQNARPDRTEGAVPNLLKTNPFKTGSASSSTITVTEVSHDRTSDDTVRFRDAISFDGITADNINLAAGYTITVVDTDSYTFTVSTDTATTGSINGGGFRAYAGPATIVA
jgi:uncharacterized iron-regulated membrane protein|tara:strand:+ start:101 stop:604 length:504 start_codon:yes stop_codon:yes gene_type:complete